MALKRASPLGSLLRLSLFLVSAESFVALGGDLLAGQALVALQEGHDLLLAEVSREAKPSSVPSRSDFTGEDSKAHERNLHMFTFLRLLHQAQGLAVALRHGHAVIAPLALLSVLALMLRDHRQ